MAFPRPVVQVFRNSITVLLSDVLHAFALGKVLPNQPVGVLVRTAFPGVMWSREVDRCVR